MSEICFKIQRYVDKRYVKGDTRNKIDKICNDTRTPAYKMLIDTYAEVVTIFLQFCICLKITIILS